MLQYLYIALPWSVDSSILQGLNISVIVQCAKPFWLKPQILRSLHRYGRRRKHSAAVPSRVREKMGTVAA